MPTREPDILIDGEEISNETQVIEEVLSELSANSSYFRLYKTDIKKGKDAFITEFAPDEFSQNNVKSEYGGGAYTLWVYNGKKKLIKRLKFLIDDRFKGKIDNPDSVVTLQQRDPPLDVAKLLETMNAKETASSDRFLMLMQENAKQAQESNKQTMQMMLGMMQMMFSQNQGAQPKQATIIDDLVKYKTLFSEGRNSFEMFQKGIEFAKSDKPEEVPFWKELLMQAAPSILPMVAGAIAPGLNAKNVQDAPPKPTQSLEEQMKLRVMFKLKGIASRLNTACRTGEPVKSIADWMIGEGEEIEDIQEGFLDEALLVLSNKNWYEELCKMDVAANDYKEYLFEIHDLLIAYLSESPEGATLPPSVQPVPNAVQEKPAKP